MSEEDASSARLLGVTLAQYAGIQAAVAEGFPLGEVLANERLTERKWARARGAWGSKIARDGHGGELAAAFRAKLAEAEDWLGRRVSPLDSDLAAWLGFLGAYAAEPAPSTFLARLGLRDEDVKRLAALWKRRTDADEALAKKAVEINRTKPRAVPRVQITEARLRPFPWSPGPVKGEPAPPRIASPRIETAVPEAPIERPAVAVETPSFLLPKPAPAAPSVAAAPSISAAAPAPVAPAPAPLTSGTALALELPKTVLPFAESSPAGLPTGTALALELPIRPATPFTPKGPDTPKGLETADEKASAPPAEPAAKPKPKLSTGTVMPSAEPRGPDLPFSGPAPRPDRPGDRTEEVDLAAIVARVRAQKLVTGPKKPESPPVAPNAPAPVAASAPTPVASAPVPAPPQLTLEQHASLCAELAFRPERAAETFARYRVTEAQKRALDDLYRRSEERKAAWDTAYLTYYQWLSSGGGNKA